MGPAAPGPVLRFENVTVRFDDDPVLKDVSLDVHPGETVILLGAAGSGKTVLLKSSIGLTPVESGRILLFGKDITAAEEEELFALRQRVGMLFQEGALFDSLTVEENVAYPLTTRISGRIDDRKADEIAVRVKRALEFVELGHTLEKFPSELSGGMRRRVGIARATVAEPQLVLYDSPTAGLDPITANTIMALIVKERDVRHTASILVTHRYQDGQIMANFRQDSQTGRLEPAHAGNGGGSHAADRTRFVVLRDGRLVFAGTQNELEASRDSYVSKFVRR